MNLRQFRKVGRQSELPLFVELADAPGPADLRLDSLLRVLPGQRYVGRGECRRHRLLAKFLVRDKVFLVFPAELEVSAPVPLPRSVPPGLVVQGLFQA